jgi:hypothetical protein
MTYFDVPLKTKIGFFSRFLIKLCIKFWNREKLYSKFSVKYYNPETPAAEWNMFIKFETITIIFKYVPPEVTIRRYQEICGLSNEKIIQNLNSMQFNWGEGETIFARTNPYRPVESDVSLDLSRRYYDDFFEYVKSCLKKKDVFVCGITEKELQDFLWKELSDKGILYLWYF